VVNVLLIPVAAKLDYVFLKITETVKTELILLQRRKKYLIFYL